MFRAVVPLALSAVASLVAGPLGAQKLAYEGSVAVTSGSYFFTEPTSSLTFSNGVALTRGAVTLRASLRAIAQNTTLVTMTAGGEGIPSGGGRGSGAVADSSAVRRGRGGGMVGMTRAGSGVVAAASAISDYRLELGDPAAALAVRILRNRRLALTIGSAVKVPMTDTTAFGTGQWDYGMTVSATVNLSERFTTGIDGAYWVLGDLPSLDFTNPWSGTVTIGALVARNWGVQGLLSATTSAIPGFDGPLSIGCSVFRFSDRGGFGISGSIGLTEASPDFSASAMWRIRMGN